MKKYQCNACEINICTAEYQDGREGPFKCTGIFDMYHKPQWKEIAELPKLTAEVFDRPDCPEWAKYASVKKDGRVIFYSDKTSPGVIKDIGFFDPTDWLNSLVERPAKLPDWCKEGEWVFDTTINKYIKVSTDDIIKYSAKVCKYISDGEIVQARLRPYNAGEMKALVGKVIERYSSAYLVISYAHDDFETTVYIEGKYLSADNLLRDFTINGKPCGVLEHLENGEWVR